MARNRPGLKRYAQPAQHWTNSRSNMSHLRYLRGQAHLQKEPLGTTSVGAGKFGRVQVPARQGRPTAGVGGSGLTGIQKALSAIGLGGAAHPIRRLEHPGGEMMFPYFGAGPGAASVAAEAAPAGARAAALTRAAATKVEEASGGVPAGLHDAYQALQKSERAKDVAATGVAAAGIGGAYAGGFALAGQPLWRKSSWSGPWFPDSGPAGPSGPSKQQVQNQQARDLATKRAFKQDVAWLVRSSQLPRSQQPRSFAWADRQYGRTEIANTRNYIRDHYKAPPGGWAKAP